MGSNEKCRFQISHINIDAGFTINQHYEEDKDQNDQQHEAYLHRMERRIEFKTQGLQRACIFKFTGNLGSICGGNYQRPHAVSIGPYHRGNVYLTDFDDNKWYFLKRLLLRTKDKPSRDLSSFLKEMRELEEHTRACYVSYGDVGPLICSFDFVEMMLLDGCFVIELLQFLGKTKDGINKDEDPIFVRPSMVPLLIADLLKLENQLPFLVLESLFVVSRTSKHGDELLSLIMEAIKVVCPLPTKVSFSANQPPKHLLELVYKSLMPKAYTTSINHEKQTMYTSNETIQCLTQLRLSGIKLKAQKTVGFLDIEFKSGVLEIPIININDFNMNLITNCLAWEQYSRDGLTYFTDYISFMNCLINGPKDVALLCADGIITRHSKDDASVVSFFNSLGKNIPVFNLGTSYLLRLLREIEAYYSSNWATIMRTLSIHSSPTLFS